MISALDRKIVQALQQGFPLVAEPYAELAKRAGVEESVLLERLHEMKTKGTLRKMGAVVQHRIAGFHGNALCCWSVPEVQTEAVAKLLMEKPYISHVYERFSQPGWPYNLYTVFHSADRQGCIRLIDAVAKDIDISEYRILFSIKNWKRSPLLLLQEQEKECCP